ncbi:hypothetical protein T261_2075 [Streptomyces lydicus]|nr:hypothetical protein T261_2075 [Streptomyces lydicus]
MESHLPILAARGRVRISPGGCRPRLSGGEGAVPGCPGAAGGRRGR